MIKLVLWLVIAITGLFIGLGILSQKGEAPGLIDGRLKEPGSRPNTVSSEADVQPERSVKPCLLYTSPSPRDLSTSRMPSSA